MKNITKRSAAARKAWRTRKHMAQMRRLDKFENESWLWREMVETDAGTIERDPQSKSNWPRYMKHALPNPWLR